MKKRLGITALLLSVPVILLSQTTEKAEQVLREQFPGSEVQKKTLYLTKEQQAALARDLGEDVSRVHTFYTARFGRTLAGYGIFDTHIVRTKQETLFVVMDASGIIKHVEVAAFLEPRDYLAPGRWLALFRGKKREDSMELPGITGATLTVKAVKNAVRRTLAIARANHAGFAQ